MHVRHPIWIRRIDAPGARAFAILFALESFVRAVLATVIPLQALEMLGDGQRVSMLFFAVGVIGLCGGLCVPLLVRWSARRWIYSSGALLTVLAAALLATETLAGQFTGMAARVLGVVVMTICVNLYIMDHISRRDFGHSEPLRLFYSAGAWTIGPAAGVFLQTQVADWAPYAVSAATAVLMLVFFWLLRLKEGSVIGPPRSRAVASPLRNIRRFLAQPRLVLAWLIAVGRNAWWAMFYVYVPIFAVQSGLGKEVGGVIASLGTGFLFLMPLWGWLTRHFGLRRVLINGFFVAGVITLMVATFADQPWVAVALILLAATAMVSLDAAGSVPFMLSVRPRERSEMTSVYATYRDVAELAPPGVFSLLLRFFELNAVFVAGGVMLLGLSAFCRRIHPRMGLFRPARTLSLQAGS